MTWLPANTKRWQHGISGNPGRTICICLSGKVAKVDKVVLAIQSSRGTQNKIRREPDQHIDILYGLITSPVVFCTHSLVEKQNVR